VALAFGTALGLQVNAPRLAGTAPTAGADAASARKTAATAVAPVRVARPAATAVRTGAAPRAAAAAAAEVDAVPANDIKDPKDIKNKVIIHIADDKPAHLDQALSDIEGLLRYYRDSHETARVQVVLNGRGVGLVRADTSAYARRVAQLQKEYDNLTFAACQNTLERLNAEQGVAIRLLPGVIVIDSGVAEIMRRQSQGWTYLQV
jgi:intracellular sulfur oxidation DsrE/DsrF family protein